MQSQFPKITIVLAAYNPNLVWLRELLNSIKNQTYPCLEVLICDDASSMEIYQKIVLQVEKTFEKIPYQIYRNTENQGSNKTFEKLTYKAEGTYIAYCDQDDIWESDKLEKLYEEIIRQDAVMAYSDMSVIDDAGVIICDSLRKFRKRIRYIQGNDLASFYLFSNCSAGCSMMLRTDIAKLAIPFLGDFICDQWLALYAALHGKIVFVDAALVRYRQHKENQSGILKNIYSKEDYYQIRVEPALAAVNELERRGIHYSGEEESVNFAKARAARNVRGIWKYRYLCKKYACFEILLNYMSDSMAKRVFNFIRK